MSKTAAFAMFAVAVAVSLVISYGLALLAEPQSLWLWRDLFGVL